MATILVVEDDHFMRELLFMHLEAAGHRVHLAEDAVIAGHLLVEQRIDLVLSDIQMPYMDGLDFVQAMRNDPSVAHLPVVFFTSHGEHESRAKELGAGFLRKPMPASQVVAAIAQRLH